MDGDFQGSRRVHGTSSRHGWRCCACAESDRRSFRVENGRATPESAPKMASHMAADGRSVAHRKLPATGENTAEILMEHGYSTDGIERLLSIGSVEQCSESKLRSQFWGPARTIKTRTHVEPVWRNGRAFWAEWSRVRNSLEPTVFSLCKENNQHCCVAHFAENARWDETSPLLAHRARPSPLICKNDYLWSLHYERKLQPM